MPPATAVTAAPPSIARPAWALDRLVVVLGGLSSLLALLLYSGFDALRAVSDPFNLAVLAPLPFALLLAWRDWPWLYLATGLFAGPLGALAFVFGGFAMLLNPASANDFAGTLLVLSAGAGTLAFGVRGFVRARRHREEPLARHGWSTREGFLLLVAAAAVVGAITTAQVAAFHERSLDAAPTADGLEPDARVALTTSEFAFSPSTIHVPAGVLTEISVTNEDPTFHTFSYAIGGTTYAHELLPGTTTRFLVKLDDPGEYAFWCDPHSPDMAGNLIVD